MNRRMNNTLFCAAEVTLLFLVLLSVDECFGFSLTTSNPQASAKTAFNSLSARTKSAIENPFQGSQRFLNNYVSSAKSPPSPLFMSQMQPDAVNAANNEWHPHDPAKTTPQLLSSVWGQIARAKTMSKGVRCLLFRNGQPKAERP